MNSFQTKVVVVTLVFLAFFFHVTFCDWERALVSPNYSRQDRIIAFPGGTTIKGGGQYSLTLNARSHDTVTIDAVLGIALPITLLAAGLFIVGGGKKRESNFASQPGEDNVSPPGEPGA